MGSSSAIRAGVHSVSSVAVTFLPVANSRIVIVSPSNAVIVPACSLPSLTPSRSVSAFSGLLPDASSSPSLRPSLSESAFFGSVPSLNSLRFFRPSLSASLPFHEPVR